MVLRSAHVWTGLVLAASVMPGTPQLRAQPLATSSQQISVTVPIYEAVERESVLLDARPLSGPMRVWTEPVHFVTNRPTGSTLYVTIEGDLNGGVLEVEPVPGSQVVRQHQPAWSAGTGQTVRFTTAGEQALVRDLRLVLASVQVRVRLAPGPMPPGPLRIRYRVGE